jgi:hypothetical protein
MAATTARPFLQLDGLAGQPAGQQGSQHEQGRRPARGTGQVVAEGGLGLLDAQGQGEQPEGGDQGVAQPLGKPVAEQGPGRRAGQDGGHVEQSAESSHRPGVPFHVVHRSLAAILAQHESQFHGV